MSSKNLNYFPHFIKADYSPWQRDHSEKKTAAFKVLLPSARTQEIAKPSPSKPKDKPSGKKSTAASSSKRPCPRREKTGNEIVLTKAMINIRILQEDHRITDKEQKLKKNFACHAGQRLSKAKKSSLEEVKRHSRFLLEKNQQLMEDIEEKDAETSRCARDLLQQYDMFGTIIATLQDSSQNQVGVVKAELQEAEKMVDKNMGKLDQELSRMTTKVHTLQEELNFLRTYMDKEYPVKSVQIASLLRSIKDLNEEQQDELEEAKETANLFLETITENIKGETDKILQAVIDERLSDYQGGLQQMGRNNEELRRQIQMQQKIIDDLEEEIHDLHTDTMMFHNSLKPSQCVIFEDVLLPRPICTPDMEIVLNIPTEEDLFL